MDRNALILAAMVPGGTHPYTPVQIQKLLFLVDRQIPQHVGGPHFNFTPYHYGPFDRAVYHELNQLEAQGLVAIDRSSPLRTFSLTASGIEAGTAALKTLPQPIQDFLEKASTFVRTLSFSSLVSAIYKAFPDMRENSVFQS